MKEQEILESIIEGWRDRLPLSTIARKLNLTYGQVRFRLKKLDLVD